MTTVQIEDYTVQVHSKVKSTKSTEQIVYTRYVIVDKVKFTSVFSSTQICSITCFPQDLFLDKIISPTYHHLHKIATLAVNRDLIAFFVCLHIIQLGKD